MHAAAVSDAHGHVATASYVATPTQTPSVSHTPGGQAGIGHGVEGVCAVAGRGLDDELAVVPGRPAR